MNFYSIGGLDGAKCLNSRSPSENCFLLMVVWCDPGVWDPNLIKPSKHGGCWMFIPLLMMKYVCLGPGAARAARCGHCWAEERVTFGQRNGLKPDPQTDERQQAAAHPLYFERVLFHDEPTLLDSFKVCIWYRLSTLPHPNTGATHVMLGLFDLL